MMTSKWEAHAGPVEARYHHVGTGHTESRFFCDVCDGWYGVPHDYDTHEHTPGRIGCACRACQEYDREYPQNGKIMTHESYRKWWRKHNARPVTW